MNFELSIYGLRSERIELPAVSLKTWSFRISPEVSGFDEELTVPMVAMYSQWCFAPSRDYKLWRGKDSHFERQLHERDVYKLEVSPARALAIQVTPQMDSIPSWECYVFRKKTPSITIGSSPSCVISIRNAKTIPNTLLRIIRGNQPNHAQLRKESSEGLCYVNNRFINDQCSLAFGDLIDIAGARLLYLGELIALQPCPFKGASQKVSLERADDEMIRWVSYVATDSQLKGTTEFFSPAPRMAPDFDVEPIDIEGPPNQQNFNEQSLLSIIGPQLTSVVPMAAAAALTTVASPVGLPMMIAHTAGSAYWSHRNQKERKKEAERYERLRVTKYREYLAAKRQAVANAYARNRTRLIQRYPAASEVVQYTTSSIELWNRNRYQPDFGFVRLGLASCPSPKPVNIPAERFTLVEDDLVDGPALIKADYEVLEDVPVGIDLMDYSLFGVVGEGNRGGYARIVRSLIAQLCTSYRYDDLRIAFVCDGSREDDRDLANAVRWLPHVWSENRSFRFIANSSNSVRTVLREIAAVAAERSTRKNDTAPTPHYVVFVMPGTPLNSTMASTYLLDGEANLGFTTFVCADTFARLPNACAHIIECTPAFCGAYSVRDARTAWLDITFDTVSNDDIARLSRRLCAVRLEAPESDQGIPSSLSFFDLYGAQTIDDLDIGELWRTHSASESLAVPIGRCTAGVDYLFDVHEKYHGPHGLVAGTTGSGKSEMLMALILSLVVNFGPDEVAFLLVDFKGGGLANHFEWNGVALPHVVGTITNLSGNAIQRALAAVRSENERRQRMLAAAHVNDVYEYARLYHNHAVAEPMPHLIIVVDEFAELKTQFPEFIDELVSVATIGRALGVHLVLATQKPAGVVSGAIEANANFRLCLRVQTKEDSKSMIDVPDAARDKLAMPPGRALIKIGAGGYLEEFQSAFTRAPYTSGSVSSSRDIVRMRTLTGTVSHWSASPAGGNTNDMQTQLVAVVKRIIDYTNQQGIDPARQLWMPELPRQLGLYDLDRRAELSADTWALTARMGRFDQPRSQRQHTTYADISELGCCLIVGSNGSGKSTLLQSMLFELMTVYAPDDLWVYALDFSNHMLDCLEGYPQMGGLLHENDEDGISKLFYLVDELLDERKRQLQGGTYLHYRRHRNGTLPAIVVAIDNYASFKERTNDAYAARILRLSKQGPSHGIFLVITCGGISSAEVPTTLASNLRGRVALQLADRFAYRDLLNAPVQAIPDQGIPGRGMVVFEGEALEFQAALALNMSDDYARSERIVSLGGDLTTVWKSSGVRHIPRIPDDPTLSEYLALDEVANMLADDRNLPVGYDLTSAQPVAIDLSTVFCYAVSGKEQMGRQNFMALVMQIAAKKTDVSNIYVMGQGKGLCLKVANTLGVTYFGSNDDWTPLFEGLREEVMKRNAKKHKLELEGLSDKELFKASTEDHPIFLFIEDLTAVVSRLGEEASKWEVKHFLTVLTSKGWYHRIYIFAGFEQSETAPIRGDQIYRNITKERAGMHFGGNVAGQQLLSFDYINGFHEQSKTEPPAIGLPATGDLCRGKGKVVIPDATR